MVKEIWKKVIWPVMAVPFLAVVFQPLCIAEGGIDYWKLLFLMGIPFGVVLCQEKVQIKCNQFSFFM